MSGGHVFVIVAALSAVTVAGCADQPMPTYSYQLVPCAPVASAPTSSNGIAAAGSSPTVTPPAAGANGGAAAGSSQTVTPPAAGAAGANGSPTAGATITPSAGGSSCVVAVPQYAGGGYYYDPYWDYGWPYDYGAFGFTGFIGGRFHDHDHFHHGFHDHDFHRFGGGFHGGFHGGGFHGGFHGGGFHGGGHGGGHGR